MVPELAAHAAYILIELHDAFSKLPITMGFEFELIKLRWETIVIHQQRI